VKISIFVYAFCCLGVHIGFVVFSQNGKFVAELRIRES